MTKCWIMGYLQDASETQFHFYAKAVAIFSDISDDEFSAYQGEYEKWLHTHSGICDAIYPDLTVQVFSYVLKLHPQLFAAASDNIIESGVKCPLGVDLVPACRKQLDFMREMLSLLIEQESSSEHHCMDAFLTSYVKYLLSLRKPEADRVVPSVWVDHIWHTHMGIFPQRYAADCIRICGFQIDHHTLDN